MRVARLHGPRQLRIHDEPVDPAGPGAGRERVRLTSVGLCGSDLHWFTEGGIGDARLDRPLVIGHELAGVIEGGPRHGTPVAIDPAVPCRDCPECHAGHPNLCRNIVFAGHGGRDGGLQELLDWPADRLHPLPDGVDSDTGAMLEPLGVALHSHDLGHLRAAATVLVTGCGPIGLCLIQLLRATGATRVIAVEPLAHRREAALASGADDVLTPGPDGTLDPVTAQELGAEVVFETSGADSALATCLHAAVPGARVVLVGIPDGDSTTFSAATARRKGLTLVTVRRMKEVYPRTLDLVRRGLVDLPALVSHHFTLDDAARALDLAAAREGLKVMVHPTNG